MNEDELRLEAVKRASLLDALSERGMTMRELDETLSMSRSTVHRALGSFEEGNVLDKREQTYVLTRFGETVAARTREFSTQLGTASALDAFLNTIDGVDVAVPLGCFTDAEVIEPQSRTAHAGVKRILDLIEASDSLRMLSNVLSPLYVDVARREVVDGMSLAVIFDERFAERFAAEYADDTVQAFRTGRLDVDFAPDIPFELFLYDGKMAMAAHDHTTLPRMFVETDDEAAIEWAEDLYQRYEERGERFDSGALGPVAEAGVPTSVDH
jgi:predicted transcriptional regulator